MGVSLEMMRLFLRVSAIPCGLRSVGVLSFTTLPGRSVGKTSTPLQPLFRRCSHPPRGAAHVGWFLNFLCVLINRTNVGF